MQDGTDGLDQTKAASKRISSLRMQDGKDGLDLEVPHPYCAQGLHHSAKKDAKWGAQPASPWVARTTHGSWVFMERKG